MKKVVVIMYLLVCLSYSSKADIQSVDFKTDPKTMTQINDNTRKTAVNTEKDNYYYLSVIISVMAFVTAIVTLYYTFRTARNTTPVFTKEKQYEVLVTMCQRIINEYIKGQAFCEIVLDKPNSFIYSEYSEYDYPKRQISESEIHLECFYEKEIKKDLFFASGQTAYSDISEIKDEIRNYNRGLELMSKRINDGSINYDDKIGDICSLITFPLIRLLSSIISFTQKYYNSRRHNDIRDHICVYLLCLKDICIKDNVDFSASNIDACHLRLYEGNDDWIKWFDNYDYQHMSKILHKKKREELNLDFIKDTIEKLIKVEYLSLMKQYK